MTKTKRLAIMFITLLAIGIIVFLAGPRLKVETALDPVDLPADLDAYLTGSEARHPDIVPGAEKAIIWAHPSVKGKTRYALVFLHGFSATRREISPVCDIVAQKLEANLFYARLRGHGRGTEPMGKATANQWMNDTVEALAIAKRLGEKVVLIGNSTGSTLAVWAATHADLGGDIHGLVLISPNFSPANPMAGIARLPWGQEIGRAVMGNYREWEPRNALEAKYWTHRYRIEVLFSMMGLVHVVDGLDLGRLQVPVMVIHSDRDQVISVKKLKARYREIGSTWKRIVTINDTRDEWGHILAGDIISPETTAAAATHIMNFFSEGMGYHDR